MKKISLLLLATLLVFSCIRVTNEESESKPGEEQTTEVVKDGLFIHVKSGAENAHEVLMALSMASRFADTHDVLMYFDIHGIDMVTKDAPVLTMDHFKSTDQLFNELIQKEVTLFACPTCMKVYGVSADDLREGFQVAQKDAFFDFTDGDILTIDY